LTTFRTHRGLYRYCRLVFGLSSSAEIFQRTMEVIVQGLEGVVVYVDDILVYGKSLEEHNRRLKAVLRRLQEYGIRLNSAKCEIAVTQLKFVVHVISDKGIRPSVEKLERIVNWRSPKDKSEVQSLLGLIQYVLAKFTMNMLVDERLEVRDRDREEKRKGKEYMDGRHQSRTSDLKEGDWVLAKRMIRRTKFDTNFNQEPCELIRLNGPEALIRSTSGNTYRRSLTHLKKINDPTQPLEASRLATSQSQMDWSDADEEDATPPAEDSQELDASTASRPRRGG
jgi:Reverse transcriptase (RNA-dependent DNA polymerase)